MEELKVEKITKTPMSEGMTLTKLSELLNQKKDITNDLKKDAKIFGCLYGLLAAVGLGISGLKPAGALFGLVVFPYGLIMPVADLVELLKVNKEIKREESEICPKR